MIFALLTALVILLLGVVSMCQLLSGRRTSPPCGSFVTVNGRRLHYRVIGGGPHTAIYLHGSEGSLNDLSPELAEELGDEFRLILFDRPGHGYSQSARTTDDIILANMECAREIVNRFGSFPVLVIAHSWGALPALKWAEQYPEEIAGVIVAAGWFYQQPPRFLQCVSRTIAGPVAFTTWLVLAPIRKFVLTRLAERAFAPCSPDPEFVHQCTALWLNTPAAIMSVIRELTIGYSPGVYLQAAQCGHGCEFLLIAGAADLMVDPEQHTFRFHRHCPRAALVVIHGAGHMPIRSSFKELAPHIMAFARQYYQPGAQVTIWHGPAADARKLVLRYGWNSTAYQTLNARMSHWFSADLEAMTAFVTRFGINVCAGPPVCSEADLPKVTEQFTAYTRQHRQRVCFFAVEERLCNILEHTRKLHRMQIGSQPVWDPSDWAEVCKTHKSIRMQLHRAYNKGVRVEEQGVAPPPQVDQLVQCLQDWQSRRSLPPLQFLTEAVPLELLTDRRLFTALQHDRVVGYLAAAPIPLRNGWLIEQIVRSHHAPNGTAELLVNAAMTTFAEEGAEYATLGLAPLSLVAEGRSNSPAWLKLFTLWMRAHGNRFYNFGGLEAFKAKLRPAAWEPIYLVSLDRQISAREILAVASAFCAQNLISVARHVIVASIRQETQQYLARRRPAVQKKSAD